MTSHLIDLQRVTEQIIMSKWLGFTDCFKLIKLSPKPKDEVNVIKTKWLWGT